MADFDVDKSLSLGTFLGLRIQHWRIPVLVDCGAITVNGAAPAKGIKTHVYPGDKVRIADPLSPKCEMSMEKQADSDSHDYAFVPGTSRDEQIIAGLFKARPRTILSSDAFVTALVPFVQSLEHSAMVTSPINSLLIASHANDKGQLMIRIDSLDLQIIKYEALEAAVKSQRLVLKDEWFNPRPHGKDGRPIPYSLLIRGCRIGTQRPFLRKLREALGGRIQVVAPKYLHELIQYNRRPNGFIEYMAYAFAVSSPTSLKRDALKKALKGGNHNFIDGKPVQDKQWEQWVPRNPEAKKEQPIPVVTVNTDFKITPGRLAKFRFEAPWWLPAAAPLTMDRAKIKDADRLGVLTDVLKKRADFQPAHSYPMYERYGYKTFQEFMDGWTWRFEPKDKAADEVQYNAKRNEYTVIQPITDAKHQLILNFYPTTPSSSNQPVTMLSDDNPTFFETVNSINP